MSDRRLALPQCAARTLLARKGSLTDDELTDFKAAGLSNTELLVTVSVIGQYVISTYTNNLANTTTDDYWLS